MHVPMLTTPTSNGRSTRDAHSGVSGDWLPEYWFDKSKAAGGAMMDLGCHPMYLLAYFLGKPKSRKQKKL